MLVLLFLLGVAYGARTNVTSNTPPRPRVILVE